MIFLNYKTYEKGTGQAALAMSKIVEEVSINTGIKVIPLLQPTDILEVSKNIKIDVWSQKVDPVNYGAHTGSVLPESVVSGGAVGTILNHSECRYDSIETLIKAHLRAKEVGLKTLIFAKDLDELEKLVNLKPDYLSYEPPGLIGSKDISVATAEPDIIRKAFEITEKSGIPLIVGAGVHSSADVEKCLALGALGVAVASDVMMSDDPRRDLLDLASGFKL